MKRLTVVAAGLGYRLLETNGMTQMAGLRFGAASSVFPAVTCVAQASLRTGLAPSEHGMISNGYWSEELRKPVFWEQSCRLVKGPRVWGPNDGVFFFQQSLGEDVKLILSPAPIHKHGGGMAMSCYTKPTGLAEVLRRLCGKFPLWRYWGPLASPKVGRMCISYFEEMTSAEDVDEAYLYLPTLDYAAQKHGPGSAEDAAALREFRRQLERLADLCQKRGCALRVTGDYAITPVTAEPVRPNVVLRREGLFKTRTVAGMSYPDFYQSTAFAMCDHEFCVLFGEEREKAAELLLATGDYERPEPQADNNTNNRTLDRLNNRTLEQSEQSNNRTIEQSNNRTIEQSEHSNTRTLEHSNNQIFLLAKPGSWCEYKWWTDNREAPDFASHVDIHNKPGYDPTELFFFGRGVVKGTHGRACEIAIA